MSVGVDSPGAGRFGGIRAHGAFGIVAGMLVLFAAAQLAIARHWPDSDARHPAGT